MNKESKLSAQITSFSKQSSSLIFTFDNNIGFLRIKVPQKDKKTNSKSTFGSVMCKAAHYIELVDA
jgi:hypothetical protein